MRIPSIKGRKIANFVDRSGKNCEFCWIGLWKIANFVDREQKNNNFRRSILKILKFCESGAGKSWILSIGCKKLDMLSLRHGKNANFVDQVQKIVNIVVHARKNCEFCWSDAKNHEFCWSGSKKSQIFSRDFVKIKNLLNKEWKNCIFRWSSVKKLDLNRLLRS